MPRLVSRLKSILGDVSVKRALSIFIVVRVFLTGWAIVSLVINPIPEAEDEILRPYLGEPQLNQGAVGLLLGPWQRFDTQRYLHLAREGYANEENSVFPPLYPLTIRIVAGVMGGGGSVINLLAGTLISNLACLLFFILFHRVVSSEQDEETATRALIYLVIFPTGFFLFAPYTEPIFMLFALASLWSARNGRFGAGGLLGFLAASTRHIGWILIVPLSYEYWRQYGGGSPKTTDKGILRLAYQVVQPAALYVLLPALALVGFVVWREWAGLPPLGDVYEQYWHQAASIPGADLISAFRSLFLGAEARSNELIALSLDVLATLLLIVTTAMSFRRLDLTYSLYSATMLFFILLPTSGVKPLYSFSRYALAFFPTFILMSQAGRRPLINRLIIYPSILLFLYFSGQFFAWGWVA